MARETRSVAPVPHPPSTPNSAASEKPLPAVRPGTSGTEALLTTKRRHASEKFQKAQRAERAYKAKKRSAIARADYSDAKHHLKQARHHLREGVRLVFCVVRSAPYVLGERHEAASQKRRERKRIREQEKKSRLEARLARDAADSTRSEEDDNDDDNANPTAAGANGDGDARP